MVSFKDISWNYVNLIKYFGPKQFNLVKLFNDFKILYFKKCYLSELECNKCGFLCVTILSASSKYSNISSYDYLCM